MIIQLGSSFEGWLICREAARIDGQFRGHLVAEGRIELGRSSDVTGRIEAQDILVEGRFEGQLIARHSISLLATARVKGALHTRELAAEEGCTVSGRCHTPD